MFEQASRMKLRFHTDLGLLSVEELWDLPLTSKTGINLTGVNLDDMARELSRQVKAEQEQESFVTPRSEENKELSLKFDLVKHIIGVKLDERAEAENKEAKKAQREQILAILADKQKEELAGKSVEDLKRMLEE